MNATARLTPLPRVATACALAATVVASTSSCSSKPPASEEQLVAYAAATRPAVRHVVQMGYGREATFAVCAEPPCTAVTPKTRPGTQAAPAPATPQRTGAPTSAPTLAPVAAPMAALMAAPMAAPIAAPVPQRAPATRIVISFGFGSARLGEAGRQAIRAALPRARESERIVIAGRTDATGSDEVNQRLALARALAVRDYIRDLVPELPDTISIDARGSCCFVADNDSADGRRQNRRVEVSFVDTGAM